MSTATAPATGPKRGPSPPPAKAPPATNNVQASTRAFSVSRGVDIGAQKVVIYGPGGVGKSTLAESIKQVGVKPLFLDIGEGSQFLDVDRIKGIQSWGELRSVLHDDSLWGEYGAVVLDDLTKAEELSIAHVVATKTENGKKVESFEDFDYGHGFGHNYDTFIQLLADLDAHARANRHIICIAHECTANVPNPAGVDFIRYEPRLQAPKSGKSSIRHRVKEWCDHLVFIGYDVAVSKDPKAKDASGKGIGSGSRVIYPTELPTHWAKSRYLSDQVIYERGSAEFWQLLLKGE